MALAMQLQQRCGVSTPLCRAVPGSLRPRLGCRPRPASLRPDLLQPLRDTQQCSAAQGKRVHAVVTCAAASTPAAADGKKGSTLTLGLLFAGWYGFNTFFNVANKTVLKNAPLPFTFTNLQFAVGGLLALTMWTLGLHKKPKVSQDTIKAVLPLAAVHTLGNLLTNVSLGKVAVSFTHTIKAMEPFFSVLLSSIFLGDVPSLPVLLSLVPIVGGVVAASASEATFNWPGFLAAMGSNVTFQSRNVFSKKFMGGGKDALDNINLFSIITILSFFLLAPFTLAREGFQLTHSGLAALGVADTHFIFKQALYAALCFHAYQQVSYMILQRVSPVTHSIGNSLKRVIVIVASIIIFKNPVSQQNIVGTTIALAGVFAYSQVKRSAKKKPPTVQPAT